MAATGLNEKRAAEAHRPNSLRKAEPHPAIIRPMGAYDDLSPQQLARIRRFVEGADIDTTLVSDELRDLVEEHWPWLLPNLEPQTLH